MQTSNETKYTALKLSLECLHVVQRMSHARNGKVQQESEYGRRYTQPRIHGHIITLGEPVYLARRPKSEKQIGGNFPTPSVYNASIHTDEYPPVAP